MEKNCLRVVFILIVLIIPGSVSVEDNVKKALLQFMEKISTGKVPEIQNWGWNNVSDPCIDKWFGLYCDLSSKNIKKITLGGLNLAGTFDAGSLCVAQSIVYLSLENNSIVGTIPEEIGRCKHLTHLYFSMNGFSGKVPDAMSHLNNLKRLDISSNEFSGDLPNLARISGLLSFLAQNNRLTGAIPEFHFTNLDDFNVSNNRFRGRIPDAKNKFGADRFSGNPELCGKPLSNPCPLTPTPGSPERTKHKSKNRFLIFSGYIVLALVVLLIILKLIFRKKPKEKNEDDAKKYRGSSEPSSTSDEAKTGEIRSEYSITSAQSSKASSALVVLRGPLVTGLKFDELLKAPAELLGRSKLGSTYMVMLSEGVVLAVKRMKDWRISGEEFKRMMQRIDEIEHPGVLSAVAFYCSKQEKLLVYEYQINGSLFKLLHDPRSGKEFDWGSRLEAAAKIAEALAFMHQELKEEGVGHGNLKSTNILFNNSMEPCITEYGLMVPENQHQTQTTTFKTNDSSFQVDVYGFGVVLLELLTGKVVQNNGFDLARWVNSVVREEWSVEVFDQDLIGEGVSEERMVKLLQVALNCINPSPSQRPGMNQVAVMINTIKEEDDKSISS